MQNPKISVIVPIYNVEKYLQRCVNSLINQTIGDVEFILVNDGSTDNSKSLMEELSQKDTRIKYFTKENGGLSDARNFGIKKASGEFLSFVDSDDWIEPSMLEMMYKRAKEGNCEMVICNLQKVNEYGIPFRKLPQMVKNQKKIISLKEDFSGFGELSWFACNKIFKKELFTDIQFPVGLHFEDIATIPRVFVRCTTIGYCEEYFYNYFEREGSITRNFTRKGLDIFTAIQQTKEAFENSPYSHNKTQENRFLILNGFYSFLAYVAYVKDKNLKREMLKRLEDFIKIFALNPLEIIKYNRFGENYLVSLPLKKKIYYLLHLLGGKYLMIYL